MERWSDRPAPEQDPIERFVEVSSAFFEKYAAQVAKFAPPAAGFALFLLYFHANRFYPSFDLLQFTSLLLGAGMVGFAIIGVLWLGLLIPGLWIFQGFIKKKEIREQIWAWKNSDHRTVDRKVVMLIFLLYAGPYCLATLIQTYLILHKAEARIATTICVSLLTALLFGVAIQLTVKLPRFSFLRYVYHSWVPIMLTSTLALSVVVDSADFITGLKDNDLQVLAFYSIPLGACLAAAISALGSFGGLRYSLHFSLFFAMLIAFYSGVLAGMPERVIQKLGLGNYRAESVLLDQEYCTGSISKELSIADGCALKNVKIIWSLGDTLTLIIGPDKNARQIQLPSRFVKAIVQGER